MNFDTENFEHCNCCSHCSHIMYFVIFIVSQMVFIIILRILCMYRDNKCLFLKIHGIYICIFWAALISGLFFMLEFHNYRCFENS